MTVLESPPRLAALILYTRQFSALIDAGISLMRCFAMLAESTEEQALHAANEDFSRRVEAGEHLSEAMGQHPELFPDIYVGFVKAGEIGGVLQESFIYIAEWLEREGAARQRLRLRSSLHRLARQAVRPTPDMVHDEQVAAAIEGSRRFAHLASFCRAFEMCLAAGVPQPLALATAAGLLGEADADTIRARTKALDANSLLADVIADITQLQPVATALVRLGEEQSCLDHMLRKAADFYDAQASYALDCAAILPP